MKFRLVLPCLLAALCIASQASETDKVVKQAAAGLDVRVSDTPYSPVIARMYIAYDAAGNPKTGIAVREIESFKPITGVVVVDRTEEGFMLRETLFPDIAKIKNPKDRKQVQSILNQFKNVPFDPHAEKSAVDSVSGATRYHIKTAGYLNYMARRTALEMELKPDWQKTP